jgi:hypothetical protein
MRTVLLGHDVGGQEVRIPRSAFATHLHLIGGTGKGKTTAVHTMLHPLLTDPFEKACFFIIDRLGNFSQELLLWISSRFCTDAVRERLVYIQPSREDFVATFNPLKYNTEGECFYRVKRTTEIVLRAWASQDIQQMPRLDRWTYNAFAAAAQIGLTVADCNHFVMPGSKYHAGLMQAIPDRLRDEWHDVLKNPNSQHAGQILDSTRNRLKPYFESDILRRMFGSTESRLDVARMMREAKIVIVDLSPQGRLFETVADTIGALLLNEVLATARSLPRHVRYPTFLLLDEFQNFVGRDIESALPEVRQLGLRMILSHQSLSQLQRGDHDLTTMIFQAQSRMIFGVQGEDADLLAHEVASLKFDPRKIKDEHWTRRQLVKGHRIAELSSWSESESAASQWNETYGKNWNDSRGRSRRPYSMNDKNDIESTGTNEGESEGNARGESVGRSSSHGKHQTLVPVYEEFQELASRTYSTFDEQKQEWASFIRKLKTGQALVRLVDEPELKIVNVKKSTPGLLNFDLHTIARKFPEALERMDELIEKNFRSDFFVPAADVDREAQRRIESILYPKIAVNTKTTQESPESPFSE